MIEVPVDATTGIKVGICLIVAPGDAGKTTLAAAVAQDWVPPEQRDKLIVVGPVPKLADLCHVPNHNVDATDKDAQEAFFKRLNEVEGALCIAVDEADMYYSPGGRTYGSAQFRLLVNVGRNFGKSLILCARGTSDLSKNTVNQARVFLMGRTAEVNLLNYAEEYMAERQPGDGGIPEVRELISNLPPHVFLLWCPKMSPRWQGFMKVIGNQIYQMPPPDSYTNPNPSESTTPSEGPTSPDGIASIPGAPASSATPSGPTSAPTTIPSG